MSGKQQKPKENTIASNNDDAFQSNNFILVHTITAATIAWSTGAVMSIKARMTYLNGLFGGVRDGWVLANGLLAALHACDLFSPQIP